MPVDAASISCHKVWKVFGPDPDGVIEAASNGASKQDILEQSGHVIAVKDVSFDIREGEMFVVMGLSGSGKSTLVRCINRLIEPTRGDVLVDGDDISRMNEKDLRELRRHHLSMVFQHFGLMPHRSVEDNVAFGLEVRGEEREERAEKVAQALEQVGLAEWRKSRIHELSGGMQQRVGLARALAGGAEILLMDEPFSALDPLIRRQMQDEFINMRAAMRKTVVFITHDLIEALKLGDRVAIMRDGEIVQIGTPQDIVSDPADDYVSEFVQDVPRGQVFAAESVMERASVTVPAGRSLEDVITALKASGTTVAFVTDFRGRLQGVLPLDRARETAGTAGEAMRREFPSAEPSTILDQCLPLVANQDIPIAILDREQRLLGVVTRRALVRALQSDGGTSGNGH